ncbi:hypothetical protein LSTR_LSTR008912 [Laodelphax striatellus]|uniref:Transporter n=1 Tax=Laodelphax striatellus TaxID=195883 RepID=A0A482WLJ8_LAOST|nr:hypothetical protein LSTR_LSTR008912 [Laodelphax striatellus]
MALVSNSNTVGAKLSTAEPTLTGLPPVASKPEGKNGVPHRLTGGALLAHKVLESEKRLLAPGQKIIIVPAGRSNDGSRNHVKIQVGNTSSDSSDGKSTPPRRSTNKLRKSQMARSCTGLRPPSLKSLQNHDGSWASIAVPDLGANPNHIKPLSDVVSVRSLASIGMGSTDGKKLTIRRVPTSPSELLNIANPTTLLDDDDLSSCSSFTGSLSLTNGHYRPKRDHWANKLQFILACVGYSVGIGNLWRFPYLSYKSGGGVFLLPYFLILCVCGIPMLYMELAIGQFTRRGPIGALSQICPLLKGAGLASAVVSFFMSTYYNVIIAYALYYFFTAFRASEPWTDCDNKWNTADCWHPEINKSRPFISQAPAEEFFDRKVLQLSEGLESPEDIRWELAACLFFAWILVYFAIWRSVQSSGRVLYVTATLPFILVVAFLGRSLSLEGAEKGLEYFFKPRWELLFSSKVWVNAVAQNFNSIGIAFGSVISFASYNRYANQILVDTLTVSFINGVMSLIVGVFAFSTIGNIAMEHHTSVENVITDGPGLIFVVYPQAIAKMPFANFWAVLFFFMLLCLGLNSQFAIVEVVVTSLQDGFPHWIKRHLVCREILVLVVCCISFVLGLPNITKGGIYFFQLIDHYAVTNSIIYIALFEVIAVSWLYGVNRLSENVHHMTNRYPSMYFRFCWNIAAPFLIASVCIFNLIDYEPPTYSSNNGLYHYPVWAEAMGVCLTVCILMCVPALAVEVIAKTEGNTFFEKLMKSIKPRLENIEQKNGIHEKVASVTVEGDELKELTTLIECKLSPEIARALKQNHQNTEIVK